MTSTTFPTNRTALAWRWLILAGFAVVAASLFIKPGLRMLNVITFPFLLFAVLGWLMPLVMAGAVFYREHDQPRVTEVAFVMAFLAYVTMALVGSAFVL